MTNMNQDTPLTAAMMRIIHATHHDPFDVLGFHECRELVRKDHAHIRLYLPNALEVSVLNRGGKNACRRIEGTDFFEWRGMADDVPRPYQIMFIDRHNTTRTTYDPYSFIPCLGELDIHLFNEGKHLEVYKHLGANARIHQGVEGVCFATWAPNAVRVSVVGDFNGWDGRIHAMRSRGDSGLWELFIPDVSAGATYKFEIKTHTGDLLLKADPYAKSAELRPKTASVVATSDAYTWSDGAWMNARRSYDWLSQPMSIYEVHLGSWRRGHDNEFLNYRDLAHQLVDYVLPLDFTHVEIMPITEHPLDDSWGYQVSGYFAPTSRFGTPDDFRYFIDYLHQHNLGVILDWVPAHFPKDSYALAHFDGTALYEYEDPRLGEHKDWGTYIFNYGRNEVKNFLMASALYWIEEFHLDGLRVDAVASMLHLDYSRKAGEWIPNCFGGNEHLEAKAFLQELNVHCHGRNPGVVVIAEESTSWPQVSRPTSFGGLGFSMKWNMGWMHDILNYMKLDPIHRQFHHNQLTFGLMYAFSENFLLPLSHDEVVHGKGSLINKMSGDDWQQFANLRLLYSFMYTYPGAKLLFMGGEFAQRKEWANGHGLDWWLLDHASHRGISTAIGDLNRLYKYESALHQKNFYQDGFEWIDCNDASQSVLSYLRRSDDGFVIVVLNFTPVPRRNYRLGVPMAGQYRVLFNSDSHFYGGSNMAVAECIWTEHQEWMGRDYSFTFDLPPLGALVLSLEA